MRLRVPVSPWSSHQKSIVFLLGRESPFAGFSFGLWSFWNLESLGKACAWLILRWTFGQTNFNQQSLPAPTSQLKRNTKLIWGMFFSGNPIFGLALMGNQSDHQQFEAFYLPIDHCLLNTSNDANQPYNKSVFAWRSQRQTRVGCLHK